MEPREKDRRGTGHLLLVLVGAGLLLRGVDAHRKSLWLDELHSFHIASASSWSELIERVRVDFHPPLFFALLHPFAALDPHVLRWIPILASLGTLIPLLALGRGLGLGPLARCVLAGVFCFAPYQILHGDELRAYSMLGLCAVTMAWAAFTTGASPRARFLGFLAATGIGLWLHYFAAVAAGAIGLARLVVRGENLLPWKHLVLAGAIGLLAFLPWVLTKERWLVTDPGKLWRLEKFDTPGRPGPLDPKPGFFAQDFSKPAAIVPRTFVPMIGSLGAPVALPARAAAAVFFLLALAGAIALARQARSASAELRGVLLAAAIAYLVGLALCLLVWRQVPDQYFVVGAWAWAVLLAASTDAIADERARRAFAALVLLSSFALGACHALGAPREDVRKAVATAIAEGDWRHATYTAVLWEPHWYPDVLPYTVYAPRVPAVEPEDVPPGGAVVVVTRSAPPGRLPEKWSKILARRHVIDTIRIDDSMTVYVVDF